jgi:hypothetical protein
VYEEGLSIPIMPLAREGRMNEDLLRMVRANVREPLQVEGDIYACAASNDEGTRRLIEMMDEFEIANLDRLGETIIGASREATLARIRALPKGTYRNQLTMDGYEKPLVLNAALTISDDGLHVDFDGTSPASNHGINVVYNYCLAYTAFGVKCLVAPDVPNNAGSLAPITVSAPEGCVLNVNRPWPVAARHTVGHMLPDVVFGCLHQVMAGGVPAEGASSLWNPQIFGGGSLVDEIEAGVDANALTAFSTVIFHCGGAGARPTKDGLSATAFPSGVRTIPVEATESVAPVVFYRREFRASSGGAGKFRGGLGQVIEFGGAGAAPIVTQRAPDGARPRCDLSGPARGRRLRRSAHARSRACPRRCSRRPNYSGRSTTRLCCGYRRAGTPRPGRDRASKIVLNYTIVSDGGAISSTDWRERCGQENVRLLSSQLIWPARWWPNSLCNCFGTQTAAVLDRFVWPDMDKSNDGAGDRGHRREEGRNLGAAGNGLAPELDSRSETAGFEDIAAHFETRTLRAWLHRRQKIESDKSIHGHAGDIFTEPKWTFRFQHRHAAFEGRHRIGNVSNDQYLIEGAYFRIPAR